MKKSLLYLIPLVVVACGLIAVSRVRVSAQAAQEYSQPEPYTMTFFGPWNEGTAKTHVPQVAFEKTGTALKVTVQIDSHPMDSKKPHYIMWVRIEDTKGNTLGEKMFQATDPSPAIAVFELSEWPDEIKAFERCNIHGIWMNDVKVEIK